MLFTQETSNDVFFFAGASFWIIGFLCEFLADRQMDAFRQNPAHKGKIIQS